MKYLIFTIAICAIIGYAACKLLDILGLAYINNPMPANKPHASLTIMDTGALLMAFNESRTAACIIGGVPQKQIPFWKDSLKAIFPRDTVIALRIEWGNQ